MKVDNSSHQEVLNELENRFEKFLPEIAHNKFCKYLIGVNYKGTSNYGVKSELGRYPLAIESLISSINIGYLILHGKKMIASYS